MKTLQGMHASCGIFWLRNVGDSQNTTPKSHSKKAIKNMSERKENKQMDLGKNPCEETPNQKWNLTGHVDRHVEHWSG